MNLDLMRDCLRNRFGTALTDHSDLAEGCAALLRRYAPYQDYADLTRRIEDYLFNFLYDRLGPGMTLQLENGVSRRILIAELSVAADEVLYPYFCSMPQDPDHYSSLHAWWMSSGSPSAMRVLYHRFSHFLPYQELEIIRRIVMENLPPAGQDAWFSESRSADLKG